jgi:hypothetical protein
MTVYLWCNYCRDQVAGNLLVHVQRQHPKQAKLMKTTEVSIGR